MQKIIITYRLAAGVSVEEYTAWSRDVDQRITPFQDTIVRFEPFLVDGAEPANTGIQIFEDIDIDDWDAYSTMLETSHAMKEVIDGFTRLVDQASVQTFYGTRIK